MEDVGVPNEKYKATVPVFKQLLSKSEKEMRKLALIPRALQGRDLMMDDYDLDFFEPKVVHYFYRDTGTGKTRMTKKQMSIYKKERG
jgi:lysine/ornithine N-monooxygenase